MRKMAEKTLFFDQIFPLWFNSKLKKDSGFLKPNFPKNFFGLIHPGDLGHLVCLRSKASEAVTRATPILPFFIACYVQGSKSPCWVSVRDFGYNHALFWCQWLPMDESYFLGWSLNMTSTSLEHKTRIA